MELSDFIINIKNTSLPYFSFKKVFIIEVAKNHFKGFYFSLAFYKVLYRNWK